jgi:hypothetical protein
MNQQLKQVEVVNALLRRASPGAIEFIEGLLKVDATVHWCRAEKILSTCASVIEGREVSDEAHRQLEVIHFRRRALLEELESLEEAFGQAVLEIKGPVFAGAYPKPLVRESLDLDLIVRDERTFLDVFGHLTTRGFEEQQTWLVGTQRGLVASTAYVAKRRMLDGRDVTLRIEVHLKSFPVTAMSPLFLFGDLCDLSQAVRDATLLFAEFVFRDGKKKAFTARDLVDSLVLLAAVDKEEWQALDAVLHRNCLSPGVLLLADYWEQLVGLSRPPLLDYLSGRHESERWDGEYDFDLHQGCRYLERKGMTAEVYESMLGVYEAANLSNDVSARASISAIELGYYMGLGMPVLVRVADPSACGLLKGGCEFRGIAM